MFEHAVDAQAFHAERTREADRTAQDQLPDLRHSVPSCWHARDLFSTYLLVSGLRPQSCVIRLTLPGLRTDPKGAIVAADHAAAPGPGFIQVA